MWHPTVKLQGTRWKEDSVVVCLETALGGKSLPKPRGILSDGAALSPRGISSEDSLPCTCGL